MLETQIGTRGCLQNMFKDLIDIYDDSMEAYNCGKKSNDLS